MKTIEISKAAQYIGTGFALQLLTQREIVNWADNIISKNENPDSFFVEVSMAVNEKPQDFLNVFYRFISPGSPPLDEKIFLSLLSQNFFSGKMNIRQTIHALYRLMFEIKLDPEIERFIYQIEGDYELSYGEVDKELFHESFTPIRKRLTDFLENFKSIELPFSLQS